VKTASHFIPRFLIKILVINIFVILSEGITLRKDKKPRIIRSRRPPGDKCPECDTKMQWEREGLKCSNCGLIIKVISQYGKYPEMKHDEHGAWVSAKFYRVNPEVRFLKPTRRITKTKGKKYLHYIIQPTVPREWKDGVKVTIEPLPEGSSVKELRRAERDMNEMGPEVKKEAEKYFEKLEREADRDEEKYREYMRTRVMMLISQLIDVMNELMMKERYDFAYDSSSEIPNEAGVYAIYDKKLDAPIYIGRTRNLKRRLLRDHKSGNIRGSQFRKALGQTFDFKSEAEITCHILDNCSFAFIVVKDFEEMVRLEHFATAVLAPFLNLKLRQ